MYPCNELCIIFSTLLLHLT